MKIFLIYEIPSVIIYLNMRRQIFVLKQKRCTHLHLNLFEIYIDVMNIFEKRKRRRHANEYGMRILDGL